MSWEDILKEGTTKYWIYRALKGSGLGKKRVAGVIFDNRNEAEEYVREQDNLYPNSEHTIIEKHYN